MFKLRAFFLVCFTLTISLSSYAQDSSDVKEKKFRVAVEQKEIFTDFNFDTLDIIINSPDIAFKGYALKIAVRSQFFNIDDIIPGDFYNECRWEFFNTRQIISDFSAENYMQVWQVIGLSEIFKDSISPICNSADTKTSLAKIIISRNINTQPTDAIIPLFFLWEDCSDNTISGMSGNDLFVSEKVFQYFDNQPNFEKNKFPTTRGIPANCTKASSLNAPVKGIVFQHGGIILKERSLDDSLILNK